MQDLYESQKFKVVLYLEKKLNMRQRRWLELVKDYNYDIRYHMGKANVVANTLSKIVMLSQNIGYQEL